MPRFGGRSSRGFGASGAFPGGLGSAVDILGRAAEERIVSQYLYEHAGVPTDGTNGTYAHIAPPGALLIDVDNKTLYQNTNTQASPTWTERSAPSGGGSGLQYVDVQLNNAQIKALRASPVEILPAPGEGLAYIPAGDSWELSDVTQAGWTAGGTQRADVGLLGIGDNAGDMVAFWFHLDNDALLDSGLVAVSTHDEGRDSTALLYPGNDNRVSNYDNCSLVITNSGDAEYGGGDPANTVSLRVGYRLVPTVPFGA